MIDRTVFEDLSHGQKKSPIVSQVCGARSISPPNCWAFANFWSIVLSPEKLESTLFWYRPVLHLATWCHCNILAQLPLSLWERLWHTVFNTVFGTLCLTRKGWLPGWISVKSTTLTVVHISCTGFTPCSSWWPGQPGCRWRRSARCHSLRPPSAQHTHLQDQVNFCFVKPL